MHFGQTMDLPPYPGTEETESGPANLLWAAEHEDEEFVKFLLKRQDIKISTLWIQNTAKNHWGGRCTKSAKE